MKREIDWDVWEKSYSDAVKSDSLIKGDLMGFSPSGAADELGITRQRVHQLVNEGKLDQIVVIDKNGNICATFITKNSVSAYKDIERKPGRKRVYK